MRKWIDTAGPYDIERVPCPGTGRDVDIGHPRAGVLHTTEGGWDSAMAVFKRHYAPHFLVGTGRIAQLLPIGESAAALENDEFGVETNKWAIVQIEVCGFSRTQPYSFPWSTTDPLAWLLVTLEEAAGIPLDRPFPDWMPPLPWATESFPRRRSGKWGTTAGWFGHVEVPENAHWDPGWLEWEKLIDRALELDTENVTRLETLRQWFFARLREGWTWDQIKASANWREFLRRGGE